MGRAVPCEFCGQMFFPASLKFHQKTCQEKQQKVMTECVYCGDEMPQSALDDHLKKCKPAREVLGSPQSPDADGHGPFDGTPSRLPDGRVPCNFCGRGFAANRIHTHMKICGKLKQARPRGADGTATQEPGKVYVGHHADFAPAEKTIAQSDPRPQSPKRQQSEPSKRPSSPSAAKMPLRESNRQAQAHDTADGGGQDWRAKHREFVAAVRNAKNSARCPNGGDQSPQVYVADEQATRRQALDQGQPSPRDVAPKPAAVPRGAQPAQPSSQQRPRSPSKRANGRPSERADFAQGSRVRIEGLVHAAHLNGNSAVLLEYDADAGCWLASLENGVVKALRREHMVALTQPMHAGKSESSTAPKMSESSPVVGTRATNTRTASPKRPTQNARHVSAPQTTNMHQNNSSVLYGSSENVSQSSSNLSTHRMNSVESPRYRSMPPEHAQTPKERAQGTAWTPAVPAMEVRRPVNSSRPVVAQPQQKTVKTMSKSVLAPHPPSSLRLFGPAAVAAAQPYPSCGRVASNAALQPCPSPLLCKPTFRAA